SGFLYLKAQTTATDSLDRILSQTPVDTHKVSVLVEYGWDMSESNTVWAVQKLNEAIQLAQKLGFKKGEAAAWNALGVAEEIRDSIPKAIQFYKKALDIRASLNDLRGVAAQHNNLGNAYELLGEYEAALAERRESLRIVEGLGDSLRVARAHLNLGSLFESMGLLPEAYEQVNAARVIFEFSADSLGMARTYTNLGHIRFELEMFDEAKRWYREALRLRGRMNDPETLANALSDLGVVLDEDKNLDSVKLAIQLYKQAMQIREQLDDQPGLSALYNNLGVAHKHLGAFDEALQWLNQSLKIRTELDDQPGLMEVFNSLGDVVYGQGNLRGALNYTEKYAAIAQEIGDEKFIQRSYKDFAKIYAALGDWKKAFEYRVKYDEFRWDKLNESRAQDFERKEVLFSDGKKQREIERQKYALEQARTRAWALIGGAFALAILAGLLYNRSRLRARANRELAAKNNAIQRERERADSLLKNILPEKTAEELKAHNTVQPQRYESVTVLFSDFKNFTTIAEKLSPEALVKELDDCFRLFDGIVEKYGLEKIKTIGDAYMCAGGIPEPSQTHALDTVRAAIEMQRELKRLMQEKAAQGLPVFEMRIGIHSGPVVAGVVGSRKFAYDIWGDTVNTAARLEQTGEAGKINISETTWEAVRHEFECLYRGKLPAKNKGEIAMYFVETP
ncbi:MAG: tetratricopeptide repeat protein, partial [Saprospiraceae bacterium]|nr:tetratricopeptide repeat protein [Saprospiraceae bacterium]